MSTTAIDAILAGTNSQCHAVKCEDSGCSLSMSEAPSPNALISLEHPSSPVPLGQSHCDFLFVAGRDEEAPLVAPIELTTGRKSAHKFLRQIRGGVSVADSLLPAGVSFRFRPVAAYKHGIPRAEIAKLRANEVIFRDKTGRIKLVRCCSKLKDALDA